MIFFSQMHCVKEKLCMKKNKLARIWIEKAKEDLLYAKSALTNVKLYGLLCFHCQQAVEKYLKGYLTLINIRFRKTHKLPELLLLCIKYDKDFSRFKEDIIFLDKYYIETRYPLDDPQSYTLKEAKTALNKSEKLIDFLDSKIKKT